MSETNKPIGEDGVGTYIKVSADSGIWYNDNMVLAMILAIVASLENIMPKEFGFTEQFSAIAETLYEEIKKNQLDGTTGNTGSVDG